MKEEFNDCPWDDAFDNDRECIDDDIERQIILSSPRNIYDFLKTRIYKQDAACKAAAIILYNHIRRIKGSSRNFFCGPPGSGKTFIWQVIRDELYNNIIIANSADMSQNGWSGSNKIHTPLREIDPYEHSRRPFLVIYDEFNKLCAPRFSRSENVSASIQSELLALVQPSHPFLTLKSENQQSKRIDLTLCTGQAFL